MKTWETRGTFPGFWFFIHPHGLIKSVRPGRVAWTPSYAEGAPSSVFEGGSWFGFSLVDHQINRKQSYLHGLYWISAVLKVETPAAPWPILRVLHQAANYRIGVHIVQFLFHFSRTVDVEVIESLLPEGLPFLPVLVETK